MPSHPSIDSTQDSIFSHKSTQDDHDRALLPHSDSESSSEEIHSASSPTPKPSTAAVDGLSHHSQHYSPDAPVSANPSLSISQSHSQQHQNMSDINSSSANHSKLTPLKNSLNQSANANANANTNAKPNHGRKFSRSGFNLGITITDSPNGPDDIIGSLITSPPLRSASFHRRSMSTAPSPIFNSTLSANTIGNGIGNGNVNSNIRNSVSANNSPVVPNGFPVTASSPHSRSLSLKRSSSLYYSNPTSPFYSKSLQGQQGQQATQAPHGKRATNLSRSLSTSLSMRSLQHQASKSTDSQDSTQSNIRKPVPAASASAAAAAASPSPLDETKEKLRLLALKEMRVVELKDEIKTLQNVLDHEKKELHELRQAVQRSLYNDLGSSNNKLHNFAQSGYHQQNANNSRTSPQHSAASIANNRNRTNSLLGGLLGSTAGTNNEVDSTKSSNTAGVSTGGGTVANVSNDNVSKNTSPSNKRLSMWDSISKPLNLFSQFDNMLQSEFEKISNTTIASSSSNNNNQKPSDITNNSNRLSPNKAHHSPKKNNNHNSTGNLLDDDEDDDDSFFNWDDDFNTDLQNTPSKTAPKTDTNKQKTTRKSSLVLSKNASGVSSASSSNSNSAASTGGGLKLSRNPSYRKSINLSDHKIILPKRNSNRNFKELFNDNNSKSKNQLEDHQRVNGINKPIVDLANALDGSSNTSNHSINNSDPNYNRSSKDPNEVLQTVSSSLWNFYSDVKEGLLLSIEEERAMHEDKNNKNANDSFNKSQNLMVDRNRYNGQPNYQHKNLSVDNLIDLDSSPEKYSDLGDIKKIE